MNAFATHNDIAPLRRQRLVGEWILEVSGRAAGILLDPGAAMTGDNAIATRAFHESPEQHHLQIAAMNGKLRPLVAAKSSRRVSIDDLPEPIEVGDLASGYGDCFECRKKT